MNLVKLSNIFKAISDASPGIRSYHFGYHQDVQRNVPNTYDANGDKSTSFPHLTWVAPVEGSLSLAEKQDWVDVELYLYDLQSVQENDPTAETLLTQWNRLKKTITEVVHTFHSAKGVKIKEGKVNYFTDSDAHLDRMICVGVRFTVLIPYTCSTYTTPILLNTDDIRDSTESEYDKYIR
jgi:hypothetical protein